MRRNITGNYILNLTYNIFDLILPFILIPYITRIFSPDLMGDLSNSQASFGILFVLAGFGIERFSERQSSFLSDKIDLPEARNKISNIIKETFSTQLVTQFLFLVISVIIVILYTKDPIIRKLHIINSFLYIRELTDLNWFFTSIEDFKTPTIRNFISKILSFVLTFILVKEPSDLPFYAALTVFPMIIGNAYYFLKIKQYAGSFFIFSAKKIRLSLIKQGIPFLLPYLVLSLHENISTILVYRYLGDKETGILAQSLKIMKIIKSILFSFVLVVRPRMTNLFGSIISDNLLIIKKYFLKSLQVLLLILFMLITGLIIVGSDFVNFFYNNEYSFVSTVILYLIPFLIFRVFEDGLDNLIIFPSGNTKLLLKSNIISFLTNTILNIVLIPIFGIFGSALSLALAGFISITYRFYNIKEYIIFYKIIQLLLKSLIASSLTILILLPIKNFVNFSSIQNFIVFGIFSVLIYCIISLLIFRNLRGEILDLFNSIIKANKND